MLNIPGPWPNGGAFADCGMEAYDLRKQIRRKDFEYTEDFLLRVLAEPRNQGEVHWAVIALRNVGTSAAIPALKTLCSSRKQDIAISAMFSIASLGGQAETDFFLDALTGSWYRYKGEVVWCLEVIADPQALPTVLAWIRKHRSQFRNGKMHWQTAKHAALYMYRLSLTHTEAANAFEEIAADTWALIHASGIRKYRGYDEFMDRLASA